MQILCSDQEPKQARNTERTMFQNIIDSITGSHKKIKGTVVLMKKNLLDFNDFNASVLDRFHELLGQGVSPQLISAVHADPSDSLSKFWRPITSRLPSRLPAPSAPIGDLESGPSSQPQPSPSNTTSESQAPPSPESPSGVREPLPPTTSESLRNNILDAKLDLEKELKKTLLSLCFGAALQIAMQCKQAAASEINNSISLLSLGTAAIFGSLFTSHFIVEKMPTASRVLDKVAFFLAATTFFFAIATPFPLGIKCAIWAIHVISLIAIVICNFL